MYQGRSNTADYCEITVQNVFPSSPEVLTEVQESTMDVAGTSDTMDTPGTSDTTDTVYSDYGHYIKMRPVTWRNKLEAIAHLRPS